MASSDIETVFRSRTLGKQLTISSQTCWPCDEPAILPWCPLVPEGESPPHSIPYMQLYKLSESRAESIERISSKYKGEAGLQALFVIAEEKHQMPSSADLLKDIPFLIVIIPKRYKKDIMTLLQNASDIKATVTVPLQKRNELGRALLPKEPDSHNILFKAIQHVIQNEIVVSLSPGIQGICPRDKRLLSCFLEIIYLQHTEAHIDVTISFNAVQVVKLLRQRCFFHAHFPKDFIFFLNLAYCNYSNESSFVSDTSMIFMMKCLHELLQVPIDHINKQLRLFLEPGDFDTVQGSIVGITSVFEHTAKSFLKHCEIYFKTPSHPDLIHVSLLLISVAVKLYHSDEKLIKKADNIWSKRFSEYFKSGFSLQDMSCLDKGLHAMTVILAGSPQLMAGWKDFYSVFLNKIYNFEIMRKFIAASVKHLVRAEDDTSFRLTFLQPLTTACLTASKRKKASAQFSADNVLLEGKEYLMYLTRVINEQKWDLDDYRRILEDWMKIVFNLIDLSDSETRIKLIEWISEEEKQLWDGGESCFSTELEELLIRQSHDLPVDTLITITNTIESETFDKPKVIVEYLGRSGVPKLLCEEPVRDLMILAMNHVTQSDDLITYLKTVIESYTKSRKPLKFFEDLMSLAAQPSPDFEEKLLSLINTLFSTSHLQKQLKEQLESFFPSIPLTSNSLNWLVMKELLKKSLLLPEMDTDRVLKCVSFLFFNDMREEHFSSTRIRAALFVILHVLKDAALKDFSCLHEYSFPLLVFSQSFLTMWAAFTTLEGSLKENHTLGAFQMSTIDISEVQEAIKMVHTLKDLVSSTNDCLREKEVTYNDMTAILSGYDAYESISECIINVFGYDERGKYIHVTREQIEKYQSSFDDYVKEIESLLVRKPENLPDLARENVKSVLAGYDILMPMELESDLDASVKPSSFVMDNLSFYESETSSQSFVVYTYQANPDCTLASLESFARRLREFLDPLHDSIDVLVFNSLHKSQILKKCIEHFHTRPNVTDPPAVKMRKLNEAVQKARKIIELLVEDPDDTLSLKDVTDIFRPEDLRTYDLSVEDKELHQFYKLKGCADLQQVSLSKSLITFLELYDVCKRVRSIRNVCTNFALRKCLEDPVMDRLLTTSNSIVTEGKHIKLNDAKKEVDFIKDTFNISQLGLIDHPFFVLFSHLEKGCELYKFAYDRGYNSVEGMDTFMQEHHLVTTDLLFEEFRQDILAMLIAAMDLIFPFFDKTCSLVELNANIYKIGNVEMATSQLLTVNANIKLIRDWFNQANGEAQENNEKTLQAILGSGYYCFDFCRGLQVELTLEFQTSVGQSLTQQCKVLSLKEIEALSQELSFMNYKPDSDTGSNMNWFNEYKQQALKLHSCYLDLQYNGHPEYKNLQPKRFTLFEIRGRTSWLKLDREIKECKRDREKFVTELASCRRDFPLLSFINTQKLKVIHDSLIRLTDIDNLLGDVGFFFKIDVNCYPQLFKYLQDLHSTIESDEEKKLLHPAKLTGEFITKLIESPSIKPYLSDFFKPVDTAASAPIRLGAPKDPVTFTLISALNSTHLDLIRLIYWTFEESFPLFHQLFRCSTKTTKEDIELFFGRILYCREAIDRYLVLGINLISNDLQQVFLEKCSSLKTTVTSQYMNPKSNLLIYLVEYSPSLFQHIPWISQNSITNIEDLPEFSSMATKVQNDNKGRAFKKFEVICGLPGSGKTHYIRNRIKEHKSNLNEKIQGADVPKYIKSLSINETFNKALFMRRFQTDSLNMFDVLMHLNINLIWPQGSQSLFNELVEDINWFFFDLFILRYVEVMEYKSHDGTGYTSPKCLSLVLPTGISTSVYVEAPFWNIAPPKAVPLERWDSVVMENSFELLSVSLGGVSRAESDASLNDESLHRSKMKFQEIFPVFALLGEFVEPPSLYDVSSSGVQLVCKYLKGYHEDNLDHLMKRNNKIIKIDEIIDEVHPGECCDLINRHLPTVTAGNQMMKTIYLKYMERRCRFMEDSIFFQNNVGLPYPVRDNEGKKIGECKMTKLRSTVFEIMLQEVPNFCKLSMSWSLECHRQLIYDVAGGGRFRLLCTQPERMSEHEQQQLSDIGIIIPSLRERLSTEMLHDYLSFALNVKKNEDGKIGLIKDKKFVLTRDFVHKMLNIHERKECGMPVVIEGETGVGKTFLLELLSCLWNHSWTEQLTLQRERIKNFINGKIKELRAQKTENVEMIKDLEEALLLFKEKDQKEEKTQEAIIKSALETFRKILRHRDPTKHNEYLCIVLRDHFQLNLYDPVLASLMIPPELSENEREFKELLSLAQSSHCDEDIMAQVVCGILYGRLRGMFYKKSIHSAMTATEIESFFRQVQHHAESLHTHFEDFIKKSPENTMYQRPVITVFLDEINTSCCPGFLKEIIIDGTIDGRSISSCGNIFIVAACNPHRANSLAAITRQGPKEGKHWFNPAYYVQNLPPTLKLIMWDYGQLLEADEREYIKEKFRLEYESMGQLEYTFLAEQIAKAQKLIRVFAYENLKFDGASEDDARTFSKSTVSQRDIQRVFKLYAWLKKWFSRESKYNAETNFRISVRAVFISLTLVYYFRLSDDDFEDKTEGVKKKGGFRKRFREVMKEERTIGECGIPVTFEKALNDELAWVSNAICLPKGIAPTEALRENIYAIIVCTMTKTPVIIVGPPGSSKTLSFKIVASKFLGTKSNKENIKDSDLFKSLDPQYYQCSRKSTSHEIEIVFQRAIMRQKTFDEGGIDSLSVVLMDEAGIPEYRHESLKVLHYFLDDPQVSFVGLSNTVLDAAKTNRAISVYRTEASHDDLLQLAKYSFCHGQPDDSIEDKMEIIEGFIKIYEQMMNVPAFSSFFGLRDFIHFFTYLSTNQKVISPESVVKALEENFSGTEHFDQILRAFLEIIGSKPSQLQQRSLVDILRSSFIRERQDLLSENKVRYKLLIDSSEDQSLIRQLFAFGILKRDETKILSCSKLPGDNDAQKLYTATAIRHSVMQGHTVLIYQAEEIQECFYDLFNQHFTCIKSTINEDELLFYSNVAIGPVMKPTRVSPYFNCAMIISQSEVPYTERPFLNRFEKFSLSHKVLLKEALSKHSLRIRSLFDSITNNILKFVQKCGESSFYGFTDQTIDSLLLSMVPIDINMSDEADGMDNNEEMNFKITSHNTEKCQCDTNEGIYIRNLINFFSDTYKISPPLLNCGEFSNLLDYLMYSDGEKFKTVLEDSEQDGALTSLKREFDSLKDTEVSITSSEPSGNSLNFQIMGKIVTIYLTNQLLYLMTPEALVIHSRGIDTYYKSFYLNDQHHFSLPDIIRSQLDKFKDCKVARKFLCYTRTSPAVLELIPMQFVSSSGTEEEQKKLKDFFEMESNLFYTYIITKATSQEKLNSFLRRFFSCNSSHVLLLSADMNKLSKDTINHTRLLIEEAERMQSLKATKIIFLILHFPTNMFYSHCYPSIFLRGWRHIYMDMIGQTETTSTDVEEWLRICLLPSSENPSDDHEPVSFVRDSILTSWIKEWLPMISNSIHVQCTEDFPGSREIKECWSDLLFKVKADSVIKSRFNTYWQQNTMYELSLQAANYAITYQSTCTLSSTIEATIQSSFKNFVLFFLSVINQNMTMHTVLSQMDEEKERPGDVVQPFLRLLSVLHLPKSLKEIRLKLTVLKHQDHLSSDRKSLVPRFPFFPIVFETIEALVNKAMSSIARPLELVAEESGIRLGGVTSMRTRQEHEEIVDVISTLLQGEDKVIKLIVELLRDRALWLAYYSDAITKQLDRTVGSFSKNCLQQHLSNVQSDNIHRKLALLHYHLRVLWLDADTLSLLRILDECATNVPADKLPQNLNLTEEAVVIQCIIELLYTCLINSCKDKCTESMPKIRELGSLYYRMMNLFKVESMRNFSSQLRNKWVILCVTFHVNHLMTLEVKGVFATSIEDFMMELVKNLSSTIDSDTIIDLTALADAAIFIAFKQGNVLDSLHHPTYHPSVEFSSVIETIFSHYVSYYYDEITEDTAVYIFTIIGLVVNKCTSEQMRGTMAKYKYLFSRLLLGNGGKSEDTMSGSEDGLNPLLLFVDKMRIALCRAIDQDIDESRSLVYSPSYFKCCQKLTHLKKVLKLCHVLCDMYFDATMNRLQRKHHPFTELVSFYEKVNKCSADLPKAAAIEKQAVVHVIITDLASTLLKNENERQVLAEAFDGLNPILQDSNPVCSDIKKDITGNGLILLMRLLCACRSERVLYTMLVGQFQSNLCDYQCLHPIHNVLSHEKSSVASVSLLNYLEGKHPSKYKLYLKIKKSMKTIISSNGLKGVDDLMKIALTCYSNKNAVEKTKWTFNMSVFIAVYEEIFLPRASQRAIGAVQKVLQDEVGQYVDKDLFLPFMMWLNNPNTNSLSEKLKEFFFKSDRDREHVSCLMELAAVLFGNEENSCHAWEHLFSIKDINPNFVPGAMVDGTDIYCYLDAVYISNETFLFTKRQSLTWLSLIFTQWMNYGLLCLSLVVKPISSSPFQTRSDIIPMCLERLKELWDLLMSEFSLTIEERKRLVSHGIQNLYKVLSLNRLDSSWKNSFKLAPGEEYLSQYECILHDEIFLPAWKSMKSPPKNFSMFGNTIGEHMRELSKSVPELNVCPSDVSTGFILTVLFSRNLYNKKCPLYVLYQFLLRRPTLNIGAHLLPSLIDLYNWIHSKVSYRVTVEVAKETSTRRVLTSVLQQHFPDQEKKRLDQLDEIKGMYKRYAMLALPDKSQPVMFSTEMSFYDIISTHDGEDTLLRMILHIVDSYNGFLELVHGHFSTSFHFGNYKPQFRIPIWEITQQTCSFGSSESCNDVKDLEELLVKYHSFDVGLKLYDTYESDNSILNNWIPQTYLLDSIKDEVVQKFIIHKQFICKDGFSKDFAFSECSTCEEVPRGLFYTATYGYKETAEMLKSYPSLTAQLTWNELNELENLFHSLPYDSLLSVCGGLCLILKMLLEKARVAGQRGTEIPTLTIYNFLKIHCNIELNEVGIALCSADCISGLSMNQYKHLKETLVANVKDISELFHEWVKIGFYDFCHLPYCLKVTLDKKPEILKKIENEDEETVRSIMHQLFSLEQMIHQKSTDSATKKIRDMKEEKRKKESYIFSLPIKHYVHLQLALRRRLLDLLEAKQIEEHNESMKQQVDNARVSSPPPTSPPSSLSRMVSVNKVLPRMIPDYEELIASTGSIEAAVPPIAATSNLTAMSSSYMTAGGDLSEAASRLTVDDVAQLLLKMGLQKSSQIVQTDCINGKIAYSYLSSEETEETGLEDLGIDDIFDELRFRVQLKRVIEGKEPEHPFTPQKLGKILKEMNLDKVAEEVEKSKIDGEMLFLANDKVFSKLGIRALSRARIKEALEEKLKDF